MLLHLSISWTVMLKSRECWSKASRVDNEEHIPYINKHKLRFVQYCYHSLCLFIKKNHFYCARLMSIDFDHGSYNRRTPAPEMDEIVTEWKNHEWSKNKTIENLVFQFKER